MSRGILITGATGFVGTNLINYLNSSGVWAFHSPNREALSTPAICLNPDCDTFIHLAGKAHDLQSVAAPEEYYRVNFELTKKLFDSFLRSSASKFIFISSIKAAADHFEQPLTESYQPAPQTHYGKSKLMAEEYIMSKQLPDGKSCYILRPCMIHGPGNKGNLNLLYRFVSLGLPYPLATFNNRRSFLSVENLCFIIKEILQRDDIPSGIYHIADDDSLSTSEIVTLLSDALNKKAKLWHVPKGWITRLAKIGDWVHLPLNSHRLGKLTENFVVSNAKIKKTLRKELPVSARQGILRTARSFKDKESN